MKLSIVIPVYNVAPYIERCLLSCILQDISSDDYEVIIVNDGTPDNSMAIVEPLAHKYPNIVVVNQENQGLSAARNNGFAIAKGDYVWFVDSDDWIESNCLQELCSSLKDNVDILQLQYRLTYDDSRQNRDAPRTLIRDVQSGYNQTIAGGLPAPAQFAVYRSRFLRENSLHFVQGIYHEDSEFKPRAVYLASKIASLDKVCYNYYQRSNGSITSSFKIKNGIDMIYVMKSLVQFADTYNLPKEVLPSFYDNIGLNMNSLLLGMRSLNEAEKRELRKLVKENKHLFHCMMRSHNRKYVIEGAMFRLSQHLGFWLHSLIR